MRVRALLGVVVFVGAFVLVSGRVVSQDEKGSAEDPMMQAWAKYAQPGSFHAHLEPRAGRWKQTVKMWMTPDAPPQISTGTSENKWIMGKKFLLQEVKSDMESRPFEGMGLMGYDNFKKKYTSMWIDSMATGIMTSLGTCDDSGKVFTMIGEFDDVFSGKANQKFRIVTRIINNDTHTDEMYMTGPDGKEFQSLEIKYTRK